ncbi:MAG TPA: hypothetical protein VG963_16780, partial [Polyangiaceae bacterium]|nr:hypothetical protein [Polyangiaceae bacterium]
MAGAPALLDHAPARAQPAPAEPAPPPVEPAPVVPAPAPATTVPEEKYPAEAVITGPAAPQPIVQATAPEEEPALAEPKPIDEKPTSPPEPPKLKIGLGLHTGLTLTANQPGSNTARLSLDDGIGDEILIRPYFSAQLTKMVGMVANFQVTENRKQVGFAILDAILQVKFMDELQLWVGQHIPANDRNNMSGPFFNNSWNFAIAVPSYPFDVGARARGFTFWGLIAGGIIKYHLSMVDLQPGRSVKTSRLGARVTINLLDPENYYYASGTYYGAQDVLAIGGVVQYQKGVGAGIG